jgi:hypothetical protein
MPPPQIFVSTRSRREYPRRRASLMVMSVTRLLLALVLVIWALAVVLLWWGGV